jgi:aspartate/methionine/tyrosine aminotransferase
MVSAWSYGCADTPSRLIERLKMSLLEAINPLAAAAPESGIVAVVNHGRKREGLIPLWVGEGDLATPDFITRAAAQSLAAGDTFYTWQRGVPELRQALSRYHERLYGQSIDAEEFFVTGSGMQAIKIAIDLVAPPGSELIYLSPAWPNFAAAVDLAGSRAVAVALDFTDDGWRLDLGRLEAAITPHTRAIFVNSPSNPTGWTADLGDLASLRDLARRHGIWIIADEIYARFSYGADRAPSFFDVREAEDRIIFVNSFSKNWSMTGWRVGWICAPRALGQTIENLIQYATSGVAHFMQLGAVAALDQGDGFVDSQVARAAEARDLFCDTLLATGRVRLAKPDGAFYAFFSIDGMADTRQAALDLVDAAGVGLAPGTAFGPGGTRFLRACFHRRLDHVETAAERIAAFLG